METRYKCAHCGKIFKRKVWSDKHECESKRRFDQIHNMDVIMANKLYIHWCKRNGFSNKRKAPDIIDFLKSTFYTSFVKLVQFTKENYVPSAFSFIDWIIDHGVKERDWLTQKSLESFRVHMRRMDSPTQHVEVTIRNIKAWCSEKDVSPKSFFAKIPTGEAMRMIIENRLMPWVLFGYDQAVVELLHRLDDEKMHILQERVNTDHWIERVRSRPDDAQSVRIMCDELLA